MFFFAGPSIRTEGERNNGSQHTFHKLEPSVFFDGEVHARALRPLPRGHLSYPL